MTRWIVPAALLLLAACAPPPAETPADRAIAYWVGRPVEAVTDAWGEPTEERTADGRHLYIYEATHYGKRYYPANLYPSTTFAYGETREALACKGVFEVDEAGVVTRAEWQGYECHFLP